MNKIFITFFLFVFHLSVYAQVPHAFSSGNVISSTEMNANFTYFETQFWQRNAGNLVFTTGNIGIGTASPVNQLQIQNTGGSGHTIFSEVTYSSTPADTSIINLVRVRGTDASPSALMNGDQIGQIRFSGESGVGYIPVATISAYATGSYSSSSTPSALLFLTTGTGSVIATERMRIDQNGRVGIGTTAPANLLHIKSVSTDANLLAETSNPSGSARIIHKNGTSEFSTGITMDYWSVQEAGTERLRIDPLGNVGIGTSAPAAHLHVTGSIQTDGNLIVAGNIDYAGTLTDVSDVSLKKNIEVLTNPIEKIMGLKGVTYDWKDTKKYGKRHQIGVIAQDVQKQFPEAVTERKDGILTVSYHKLVAPLIEAVKNLHVRLLKLENQNQTSRLPASEEKLKKLESENASMKAYLCKKDPAAPFCKSER